MGLWTSYMLTDWLTDWFPLQVTFFFPPPYSVLFFSSEGKIYNKKYIWFPFQVTLIYFFSSSLCFFIVCSSEGKIIKKKSLHDSPSKSLNFFPPPSVFFFFCSSEGKIKKRFTWFPLPSHFFFLPRFCFFLRRGK